MFNFLKNLFKTNKDFKKEETIPRFRTIKEDGLRTRLILICSKCECDIREMEETESINVTIAHYCKECDTGATVLNRTRR